MKTIFNTLLILVSLLYNYENIYAQKDTLTISNNWSVGIHYGRNGTFGLVPSEDYETFGRSFLIGGKASYNLGSFFRFEAELNFERWNFSDQFDIDYITTPLSINWYFIKNKVSLGVGVSPIVALENRENYGTSVLPVLKSGIEFNIGKRKIYLSSDILFRLKPVTYRETRVIRQIFCFPTFDNTCSSTRFVEDSFTISSLSFKFGFFF